MKQCGILKQYILQAVSMLTLDQNESINIFFLLFLHLITGIFMSTCNVDVRWFPFDIQKCELKFGSWTFDGWLLDLQMNEADISGYMPNGEWDLVGE